MCFKTRAGNFSPRNGGDSKMAATWRTYHAGGCSSRLIAWISAPTKDPVAAASQLHRWRAGQGAILPLKGIP
ncbi:hypothetical protein CYMTET_53062 [Cymbomonas tetramitiformis]|uniref:Uncharacterized protein n=1 Tax=Cymbomonas tetramitiformis TaxID=36881 RepID=A0AAE0BIX4_9CHLO|nr:hypothetical protein CYMTET_53062 [Cymbomonas tetramitiformis]